MKTLNNYFVKTMKQKNPTLQAGIQKMLLHGVFLGILTISIHMLLQTLADTILSIQFSEFMAPSYASVYLTYTTLSFYFFLLFFAIHYEQFSFYGLYHNRLYFMTQLGFSPMIILLQKYLAIMSITIIIYTSGYVCTVIISLLLKYTFISQYLLTYYFCGLIRGIMIVHLILLASYYFAKYSVPKYSCISLCIFDFFIRYITSYKRLIANRVLMQDYRLLFTNEYTTYFLLSLLIIIICFVLCLSLGLINARRFYSKIEQKKHKLSIALDHLTHAVLIGFICLCGFIQIMILTISFANPSREISIQGTIPYIFESSTMSPILKKHDLVFFEKIMPNSDLKIGDIVLFKDHDLLYVERIVNIETDSYTVDIDSYPPDAQKGVMIKSIQKDQIYGRYYKKNSYLGALILFSNTIFGRFLFLILPCILIFFYQPIKTHFTKDSHTTY